MMAPTCHCPEGLKQLALQLPTLTHSSATQQHTTRESPTVMWAADPGGPRGFHMLMRLCGVLDAPRGLVKEFRVMRDLETDRFCLLGRLGRNLDMNNTAAKYTTHVTIEFI